MIKQKFENIFKIEMTENNVREIMSKPFKNVFHDSPEMLLNWKNKQAKPLNELENRALTCIYFKDDLKL